MSGASSSVVSCGLRLSEVGLSEIRKPQVKCQGTVLVTVRSRFWSRFGIYLNHTQSLSVDENSRCWFADSCSSSLSIALNRNISISPFKARTLGSSPRRLDAVVRLPSEPCEYRVSQSVRNRLGTPHKC